MTLKQILQVSGADKNKTSPKKFGLNQIRDNLQDPVRLAVKEVLKAEREKTLNV
jgi:tRNA A37 threonylcarbamoyladenosine dehydratase